MLLLKRGPVQALVYLNSPVVGHSTASFYVGSDDALVNFIILEIQAFGLNSIR